MNIDAKTLNKTPRFLTLPPSPRPSPAAAFCRPESYCMSAIQNLHSFDPFADASKGDDLLPAGTEDYIHIRIQQRNGRKTLTTVQGIADDYDKKKLVKAFKKVGLLWREHVVWSTKGEGANVKGVRVDGMAS